MGSSPAMHVLNNVLNNETVTTTYSLSGRRSARICNIRLVEHMDWPTRILYRINMHVDRK